MICLDRAQVLIPAAPQHTPQDRRDHAQRPMREQLIPHGQLAPAREPGDLTPKPHIQPTRPAHRRPAARAVKSNVLDDGGADATAEPDPVPGTGTNRPGGQLLDLPQLRVPLPFPPHIGDVVEHRFRSRRDANAVLNNVARPPTGNDHDYLPRSLCGAAPARITRARTPASRQDARGPDNHRSVPYLPFPPHPAGTNVPLQQMEGPGTNVATFQSQADCAAHEHVPSSQLNTAEPGNSASVAISKPARATTVLCSLRQSAPELVI